jgi:hypothetical protein
MKIVGIVALFVCLVFPMQIFAQQGGGNSGGGSSSGSSGGSVSNDADSLSLGSVFEEYGGVQNVSELSVGTFIGGGVAAEGFVGNVEIYNTGSNRSTNTSRLASTTRTTTRPTTTAARRTTGTISRTTQAGGVNNQTIRSATSISSDWLPSGGEIPSVSVEESTLNRLPGVFGSQVTYKTSPLGATAVLTGTVSSDWDRRVAQQILLLEPGINQVENLLDIR